MVLGVVGIVLNVILSVFKMIFGALTRSVSIIADGANNIFDAVSSIINLVGFKISGKPADKDHPFGHGRIEYISGLVVAAIILNGRMVNAHAGDSRAYKITDGELSLLTRDHSVVQNMLENGEIVESGSHDELMLTSETYRDIYNSQIKNGGSINE